MASQVLFSLLPRPGVQTSQKSVRKLTDTNLYGNVGNDTIIFGESLLDSVAPALVAVLAMTSIGNYTNVGGTLTGGSDLSLTTSEAATLEGGGGNDTVRLIDDSTVTYKQLGFNGGQGNDSVHIDIAGGTALSATIGGGGGNDTVNAIVGVLTASTVAGGGGNDTVTVTLSAAQASFVGGDNGDMSLNSYDGDDLITGVWHGSGNTVFAGGGNDTLNLQLSGQDNDRIALNSVMTHWP